MAVGPQAIDRGTPPDLPGPPAEPARQYPQIAGRHILFGNRRRLEIGMRARDQPAPRQRHDPAAMPGCVQRKDEIDHSQPGSDQQRGFVRSRQILDSSARCLAPRIAEVMIADARECCQRSRLLIAGREHDRIGVEHLPIVERDPPTAVGPCRLGRDTINHIDSGRFRFVQDGAEIAGEEAPLGEAASVPAVGLEMPREMVRFAGPGAHALGPDIEQMRRFGGRISNPLAGAAAAVDQCRRDAAPRQLGCDDGSGKAATDDRDRHPVRSHSQASSPGPAHWLCATGCGRRSG
jgi:hypothetical protein